MHVWLAGVGAEQLTAPLSAPLSAPVGQIVDAVVIGIIGTITLGFALLAGWMRRRFGIDQEREVVGAMREVQREHVNAQAAGAPVLTGPERHAEVERRAAERLLPMKRVGLRSKAKIVIDAELPAIKREMSERPPRGN